MATKVAARHGSEPVEGKKHLSKHRNVNLPVGTFEERERPAEYVPYTPIQQTLSEAQKTTHNQSTETLGPPRCVNFRIYLTATDIASIDERGVDLSIESGKTADVGKLLFHLAEQYKIDFDDFKEMFALWMISPLLEVQLKPYHRPYECRQGWVTLLNRFACESMDHLFAQDEPLLMFKRNATLSTSREIVLINKYPQCAHFLAIDARERLLNGRIQFLSIEHTVHVAALLFCLQYGNFNETEHDVAFIRAHLEDILPERTCDNIAAKTIFGKAIIKKTAQEENLLKEWKKCSSDDSKSEKERKLLLSLMELSSCYGAAWFNARIEKKTSRFSVRSLGQSYAEINVRVGINERWLTILDAESLEPLLVQSVDELTWQLESPKEEDQLPFLILNMSSDKEPVTDGNGVSIEVSDNETTIFLMIIGNQTLLIDALLKTLTGYRLERTISHSSASTDSSTSSQGHHDRLVQSKLELKECSVRNNRKLCMATFQNGKCTDVAGSFKSFYSHGKPI